MKRAITYLLIIFVSYSSFSQVGIGNTDPKAQLDISAGLTPSEKDGILIPRLDEFPTGVDANQDGMLLFITGNGTPTKGFYYWNNDTTGWITVGKSNVEKIDDLSDAKSDDNGSSLFLGIDSGANDDGTDNQNIGIGFEALKNNTDGFWNVAIGYQSLLSNTGSANIALGWNSLKDNSTGYSNLGIGHQSLNSNDTGYYNTAIGTYSLLDNISGNLNVAIGGYALANITNETENTAVGTNAGRNSSGESNVFLGYSSGYFESGSNKLYIENSNANQYNALIYGEFDNNILRTNSEFQIGNPTGTGYAFPTTDGTSGQVLSTDGNGQISFETIENDNDWHEQGTTNSPNSINDDIFTRGNVAIGNSGINYDFPLHINSTSNSKSKGIYLSRLYANTNSGTTSSGLEVATALNTGSVGGYRNNYSLLESSVDISGSAFNYSAINNVKTGNAILSHNYLFYGLFNQNTGTHSSSNRYGSYIEFSTNTTSIGNKYGFYTTIPSTVPGTHYGIYSDVQSNAGYAGYFLGRTSFGNTTANRYILPSSDGTAGQVLSTDGNGQISFTTLEEDVDWYEEGTTTAPNSITDNIYTQGNVAIDGETYISDKLGIGSGAEDPDGYLEVRANNTVTQPNIKLVDIGSSGPRISFTNTGTTNGNTWTLFGDTNNTSSSSYFHLFHTTTGNILTARGNGDVGLKGTPNTDFHIFHGNSSTADGFKLQNSTDNTWWRFYISSGTDDLRLYNSNNGTTMMGAFNDATGAYTSTSDRRLKKDFKSLHFSWNTFMQLSPLTYKYKKDSNPTNYIGMVAQDVEKIYPELVSYQVKDDIYHMDYSATGVVAIKAVQELKNNVNVLEEKIENLATENTKLKVQLSKYESIERRLLALEQLNKTKSIEIAEVANGKK